MKFHSKVDSLTIHLLSPYTIYEFAVMSKIGNESLGFSNYSKMVPCQTDQSR